MSPIWPQRRRPLLAAVVVGLFVAGLAAWIAWPSSSSHPTPPANTGTSTYEDESLSFAYPVAWRLSHYDFVTSMSYVVGYLSNAELHDPCVRWANGGQCKQPLDRLADGQVLVTLEWFFIPGININNAPGSDLTVGGRPARSDSALPPVCSIIGGDEGKTVNVQVESADLMLTACFKGPGLAQNEALFDQMLATVTFKQQPS